MLSWRRSLSLIATLAFAAGSILTSTSLVWCVGRDGYHGIERSGFTRGAHIDHHSIASLPSQPFEVSSEDAECRHWTLLDAVTASYVDDGKGCLTFALRKVVLLTWPDRHRTHFLPVDLNRAGRKANPPDMQSIERRSVVLLI